VCDVCVSEQEERGGPSGGAKTGLGLSRCWIHFEASIECSSHLEGKILRADDQAAASLGGSEGLGSFLRVGGIEELTTRLGGMCV
jgi:hypothetical protein